MKVLVTIDALINAGTERSMLDLSKYFSRETVVELVYFYPRHDLKDAYQNAGIKVHFLDLKGKYDFYSGIRKLQHTIREVKPDVVVSSLQRANFMSRIACLLERKPLIGTFVNDTYGPERLKELKGGRKWKFLFFYKLDQLTSFIPACYISNAQSIADTNAKALRVRSEKIKVVYRGRSTNLFKEWAVPGEISYFNMIAIGRLLERKGFGELLEAIQQLKNKGRDIRLTIYGEGVYRESLEAKLAEFSLYDCVKLVGAVPQAFEYIYQSHLFVFPSWYEGFSGALVEAMMTGIPIVCSDIPMNLEAVTDGKTAIVHRVHDINHLAESILWVMDHYDDAVKIGKQARQVAFERFDIKGIAEQYEQVLKEVILAQANHKKRKIPFKLF